MGARYCCPGRGARARTQLDEEDFEFAPEATQDILPPELWLEIFEYLEPKDEIAVLRVCRYWREVQQSRQDKRVDEYIEQKSRERAAEIARKKREREKMFEEVEEKGKECGQWWLRLVLLFMWGTMCPFCLPTMLVYCLMACRECSCSSLDDFNHDQCDNWCCICKDNLGCDCV